MFDDEECQISPTYRIEIISVFDASTASFGW